MGYLSRPANPRIGDDDRDPRRKIPDGRVSLSPGLVLEELEAVVTEDDDNGVVGQFTNVEIGEDAGDLIVEISHAAVVKIDDLLEVELRLRLGLGPDDLPRIAQLGHDEFRFATIFRIGIQRIVWVLGGKRRVGGRHE